MNHKTVANAAKTKFYVASEDIILVSNDPYFCLYVNKSAKAFTSMDEYRISVLFKNTRAISIQKQFDGNLYLVQSAAEEISLPNLNTLSYNRMKRFSKDQFNEIKSSYSLLRPGLIGDANQPIITYSYTYHVNILDQIIHLDWYKIHQKHFKELSMILESSLKEILLKKNTLSRATFLIKEISFTNDVAYLDSNFVYAIAAFYNANGIDSSFFELLDYLDQEVYVVCIGDLLDGVDTNVLRHFLVSLSEADEIRDYLKRDYTTRELNHFYKHVNEVLNESEDDFDQYSYIQEKSYPEDVDNDHSVKQLSSKSIKELESDLVKVLNNEDYEKAAEIRDEIQKRNISWNKIKLFCQLVDRYQRAFLV